MAQGATERAKGRKTCCPACGKRNCLRLECLERPRFFGGQLLTQNELNGLLDYIRAKNRLHNRLLHGWGTVCGLEVSCHACPGWVTIHPGYAIDPCGNDLVVCEPHDVNLVEAIKACIDRERRRDECGRPKKRKDPDEEEVWCVALRYDEQALRPVAPLRNEGAKPCRRCDAQGRCGCGCESCGKAKARCSCAPSRARTPIECEPTRIAEGYKVEVCRSDAHCPDRMDLLQGTLPARAIECMMTVVEVIRGSITSTLPDPDSARGAYELARSIRTAVLRLYQDDPLNVRCTIDDGLAALVLRPPANNETQAEWLADHARALGILMRYLIQYVIDCICQALLPPCPEQPEDDAVCLACVKLKGGEIEHICNLSCRKLAGSFASLGYWLPIGALIKPALCGLCCELDLFANLLPDEPKDDPASHLKYPDRQYQGARAVVGDLKSMPMRMDMMRTVGAHMAAPVLGRMMEPFFPETVSLRQPRVEGGIPMATEMGKSSTRVAEDLQARGMEVDRRALASLTIAERAALASSSRAMVAPDARVELVFDGSDRVVGWRARSVRDDLSEARDEIRRLRVEIDELKSPAPPPPGSGPDKDKSKKKRG
ncbi:MAG: hypothetical protein K8H88_27860 [Sandaracinaceae bacterium]|nr:hypothetical protein [Sandaracinaceae bacterium]